MREGGREGGRERERERGRERECVCVSEKEDKESGGEIEIEVVRGESYYVYYTMSCTHVFSRQSHTSFLSFMHDSIL